MYAYKMVSLWLALYTCNEFSTWLVNPFERANLQAACMSGGTFFPLNKL